MFRGVSALNLDGKGRMAIPARHRGRLADCDEGQLILTVDNNSPCLLLYPLAEWEEIERKLIKLPSLDKQARRLQRLLIGYATECDMDGAGRILVPSPLRSFARLEKRVVMIGQGNKFEIWNEQTWQTSCDEWISENDIDEPLSSDLESLSL